MAQNLANAPAVHVHYHMHAQNLIRHRRKRVQMGVAQSSRDDTAGMSQSWRNQTPLDQINILREAVHDLQALHETTDSITKDELAQRTAGLSNLITSIAPTHLFTEQNPSDQDHISNLPPELIELVLSMVSIKDVLSLQQVSHHLWKTISSSSRMQAKLLLHPTWNSHLSLPFDIKQPNDFTTFSCYASLDLPEQHQPITLANPTPHLLPLDLNTNQMRLTASFNTNSSPLPTLGPRASNMLICQPPITEMDAHPDCCSLPYPPIPFLHGPTPPSTNTAAKTISNPTGITIGNIRDATEELMLEHRLCPHAGHWLLDAEGYVKPMVYFEAKIVLADDDPVLVEAKKEVQACSEQSAHAAAKCVRMRAYAQAKLDAREHGQPIPTLKEFEGVDADYY